MTLATLPPSNHNTNPDLVNQTLLQGFLDYDEVLKKWYLPKKDDLYANVTWRFYPNWGLMRYREMTKKIPLLRGEVITWDSFAILALIQTPTELLYRGHLEQKPFDNLTLDEVLDLFKHNSIMDRYKQKLGVCLHLYTKILLKTHIIPLLIQEKKFGFYDKWYMPDKYVIACHKGIQTKCKDQFVELFETAKKDRWNVEMAKQAFIAQYTVTTIEHKDIIFAWAIMQSFFYPLMKVSDLTPFLFLWGSGDMKISSMGKNVTSKWWNHLGKDDAGKNTEAINGNTTMANLKEYIATINLGYLFDDIHKGFGEEILGLLKSYLTIGSYWGIKNKKSEEETAIAFKCSPFFTGNEVPLAFLDPQFLMRGIVPKITKATTAEEKNRFIEVMNKIPNGLIGWAIYQITENWTQEQLIEQYNKISLFFQDAKIETRARANTIIRLLTLGKQFCKEWFGIELNLIELPIVIQSTKEIGNMEIREAVQCQLINGDLNISANRKESIDHTVRFDCSVPWIKSPIYSYTRNKVEGKIYTLTNYHDLCLYLRIPKNQQSSLRQLFVMFGNYFSNEEFIDETVRKKDDLLGTNQRYSQAIFIPLTDLEKEEIKK